MKEQIQKLIERMQELRSELNRNAVLDNTDNLQSEYSDDLGQVCEILEDKLNLENEIADLKSDWNKLCDYLGNIIANDNDCENGCYIEFLKKVNEIRPYKADIKKE